MTPISAFSAWDAVGTALIVLAGAGLMLAWYWSSRDPGPKP